MKSKVLLSMVLFMALNIGFLASSADAAVVYRLIEGEPLYKVGVPNPEGSQGATSTATAAVSAGQIIYISYCVTMTNQGTPAVFQQIGMNSFGSTTVYSEPAYAISGADQRICNTSTTTTLTDINLGQDYWMEWETSGVHTGMTLDLNSSGDFLQVDSDAPSPPPSFATKVISTVPYKGQTIATSTTAAIGGRIYVNNEQWLAGRQDWFIKVSLTRNTPIINPLDAGFSAVVDLLPNSPRVLVFPITSSGYTTFSTTTRITLIGDYNVTTEIDSPASWWTNFILFRPPNSAYQTLDATTTQFTAVVRTAYDRMVASSTSAISEAVSQTAEDLGDACFSWTSFSIARCLNLLFLPDSRTYAEMTKMKDNFLTFPPIGYFTRFVVIVNGNATSTFPLIQTGIPDPMNPTQDMSFTYDVNEALAGAGTVMDNIHSPTGDHVTPREAMDLVVKTVIAASVMMFIIYDVIRSSKRGGQHTVKTKLS